MSVHEVLHLTRDATERAEAAGATYIKPHAFRTLLSQLEAALREESASSSHDAWLEHYKAQLSSWVSQQEQINAWNLESFRQIIGLGQAALKSAVLINGGAAVALLAFIGHLVSLPASAHHIAALAPGLRWFVLGVLLASLASGTAYLGQRLATWRQWCARLFDIGTILLAAGAFGVFLVGMQCSYNALQSIAP